MVGAEVEEKRTEGSTLTDETCQNSHQCSRMSCAHPGILATTSLPHSPSYSHLSPGTSKSGIPRGKLTVEDGRPWHRSSIGIGEDSREDCDGHVRVCFIFASNCSRAVSRMKSSWPPLRCTGHGVMHVLVSFLRRERVRLAALRSTLLLG